MTKVIKKNGLLGVLIVALLMPSSFAIAEQYTDNGNSMNAAWAASFPALLVNSYAGEIFPNIMGTSISSQRNFAKNLPSIYSYSQTTQHQKHADAKLDETTKNPSAPNLNTIYSPNSKLIMWGTTFTNKEIQKRDSGQLGYENSINGVSIGVNHLIGESSSIGIALGYDYSKQTGKNNYFMRNQADTLHIALLGATSVENFSFDTYAGYSHSWNKTTRASYVTNTLNNPDINRAKFNSSVISAGLKGSYAWVLSDDFNLIPSIGLDFSYAQLDSIKEKGYNHGVNAPSITPLKVYKGTYTSVALPLLASLNKTFSSSFLGSGESYLWTPEIRGGYVMQFGSKNAKTTNQFAIGGPSWKTTSADMNKDYSIIGAGLKFNTNTKHTFSFNYDHAFASKYQSHNLVATYGASF